MAIESEQLSLDLDDIQEQDKSQTVGLSVIVISLLKGVIYQDTDPKRWSALIRLHAQICDYVDILGLELILDEAEGYAFLRAKQDEQQESEIATTKSSPELRLFARRPLSFAVSLLLALLRKKLAEFDASGSDTRLILTKAEIVELLKVFLPESSNEVKLTDQIEKHINKVVELGFLYKLKQSTQATEARYEVKRIIKAFVDAQWLAEFEYKLVEYKQYLQDKK
ncbi:DUF4194 domain-containing protein [Cysteiniphilum sp. JM-1]|uniref:DUF4194 domain-containing protein n=1 Tax=Cysteiniphilum sp. JM-1 TaxID=2610891 RepID=UPI0012463C92|nr:DUF4194 domain-containing protein [Cysteiniphilum sp. JM-1]